MPYPPQEKALRRKEDNITPVKTNAPNFFRTSKINNSNLSNEKQRI